MPHLSFMWSLNTTYVHTPFHTLLPQPHLLAHSPHIWLHVGFHPYTSEQPAGTLIYAYQSMTCRPHASMHSISNLHCSLELSLTGGAGWSTLKPRFMPQLHFAFLSFTTGWGEFVYLQNLVYIRGCNIHINDTESWEFQSYQGAPMVVNIVCIWRSWYSYLGAPITNK